MSRFISIQHEGRKLWWDGHMWNHDPSYRKDLTQREVTQVNRMFANQKGIDLELEFRK